jgi:shikimate dehydrogenase
MKRVFLLGFPVGHSISPTMQNAALRHLGIDWQYELLETSPDKLRDTVARLRNDDCIGANVTIPHKQAVMEWLDEVSDRARKIGAVNTIIKRDGKLLGDNTDAYGVLQSFVEENISLRNARVVVFGAGGAARGTMFALGEAGVSSIAILNRTQARADVLADFVRQQFPNVVVTTNKFETINVADIIINTTSVGMIPNTNASPMPNGTAFPRAAIAFDLVYRPLQTKFLRDAENVGAKAIGGLGMLVHQGALSLKLWTRKDAPVSVMRDAAENALRNTQ